MFLTLLIILISKCSLLKRENQLETANKDNKSSKYIKTSSECKETASDRMHTFEGPIDLRIKSKKLADLPLDLSYKPQYEEANLHINHSIISTVTSDLSTPSKNTGFNLLNKRKRKGNTDEIDKNNIKEQKASKKLLKSKDISLKPRANINLLLDAKITLGLVRKLSASRQKTSYIDKIFFLGDVSSTEIMKKQGKPNCEKNAEKNTKNLVGKIYAQSKLYTHCCKGFFNVKYYHKYLAQSHQMCKKEADTASIASSFNEFVKSEIISKKKFTKRTDPITSYEYLNLCILEYISDLEHVKNFAAFFHSLNFTFSLETLEIYLDKIGGQEVVNIKNNEKVDSTCATIYSNIKTLSFQTEEFRKNESSIYSKQLLHTKIQKHKNPFLNVDKDYFDGISHITENKQAVFVCLKAYIEDIIFKEESNTFFLEIPELIFYLEWRLQYDYFDQDKEVWTEEMNLIKNVLNSYSKSDENFLKNIFLLRTYIEKYLDKYKEKFSLQYYLYNYAMQIPEKSKGHILRNRHKIRFMFFLLSFTMNSGVHLLKILKKNNQETRVKGYKDEPTYLYNKRLLKTKEPASDIILTLQLVLKYLQLKKKFTGKNTTDTLMMNPHRTQTTIYTKCGHCGQLIINVSPNTEIAHVLYDEIIGLMEEADNH